MHRTSVRGIAWRMGCRAEVQRVRQLHICLRLGVQQELTCSRYSRPAAVWITAPGRGRLTACTLTNSCARAETCLESNPAWLKYGAFPVLPILSKENVTS